MPGGARPITCRSDRSHCLDNPLLREPLRSGAHQAAAARPLGNLARPELHLRSSEPHHRRARSEHDLRRRPRSWRAGAVANTYLEGTYSEIYPNIAQTEAGMRRLFTQFSFPGGIPSHVAPERPGRSMKAASSAMSLMHAFGAAFDNPDLIVLRGRRRRGRDRAARGSWHSNEFLNPARDGAVLPILHLNGYKIAGPTVLARISDDDLHSILERTRLRGPLRRRRRSAAMHQQFAATLDACHAEIRAIQNDAAQQAVITTAALAADRAAHAQRLDRPEGRRRHAGRRHLSRAPGAARGVRDPTANTCSMLEEWMRSYRAGGAVRRRWPAHCRVRRARARRRPPHGREPACQRRHAVERPRTAGLQRLCGGGAGAGHVQAKRRAVRASSCAT